MWGDFVIIHFFYKKDQLLALYCHGEVYSIQHYVIKFVSDLRQVGVFFPSTLVSSYNKTDRHDITEILLKVAF